MGTVVVILGVAVVLALRLRAGLGFALVVRVALYLRSAQEIAS